MGDTVMTETRLTRLTTANTDALKMALTAEERERVTIGATVATFAMPAGEAHQLMIAVKQRAMARYGGRTHPVPSLHAVIRKLANAANA